MKKNSTLFILALCLINFLLVNTVHAVDLLKGDTLKINFQPKPGETSSTFNKWGSTIPVPNPPDGYFYDFGQLYGNQGNGFEYGCLTENFKSRWRKVSFNRPDSLLFQSFNHMQNGGAYNIWEVGVPNGSYNVLLVAGDPNYGDFVNTISIEGKTIVDQTPVKEFTSGGKAFFDTIQATVVVTDGRLTIKPDTSSVLGLAKADNVKFAFVRISKLAVNFSAGDTLKINFQPMPGETNGTNNKWGASTPVPDPPSGYFWDQGQVFGPQSNGLSYGCQVENKKSRWRKVIMNRPDSLLFQTFNHMQNGGTYNVWEVEVPNGNYNVLLVAGDPNYGDFINTINFEGTTIVDQTPVKEFTSGGKAFFDTLQTTVMVTDGKLTIKPDTSSVLGAAKADNVKFVFVHIWSATEVAVKEIKLSETSLALKNGETRTLTATVLPENATNKTFSWSSSDAKVATVNESGKITAIKEGTCTIEAITPDGLIKAQCQVVVTVATSVKITNQPGIRCYPNPLTGNLLVVEHDFSQSVKLSVFDMTGQLKFVQNTDKQKITIDCQRWSKGVYFVKINDQVKKLIIE